MYFFRPSGNCQWKSKRVGQTVLLLLLGMTVWIGTAEAQPVEISLEATYTSPNPERKGHFGSAVAEVGDVNSDGTIDLLVGAASESSNGIEQAGRAYLLSGKNGQVIYTFISPNAEQEGEFGASVASADIDGNEKPDFLIGAPGESLQNTEEVGKVYLFSGEGKKLIHTFTSSNPTEGGEFGQSTTFVEDFNNDSVPDFLVGASGEHDGAPPPWTGRAYLFSGDNEQVIRIFSSPNPGLQGSFGTSVANVKSNFLIGAPGENSSGITGSGQVYFLSGNSGERLQTLSSPNPDTLARFGSSATVIKKNEKINSINFIVGAEWRGLKKVESAGKVYFLNASSGDLIETLTSPNPEKGGGFGSSITNLRDTEGYTDSEILVDADGEIVKETLVNGRVYHFEVFDKAKELNPNKLPKTHTSLDFTDPSGNDRLDGGETATVRLTVRTYALGTKTTVFHLKEGRVALLRPFETPQRGSFGLELRKS